MTLQYKYRLLAPAAFAALCGVSSAVHAQALTNFTPGDIVVLQGGDTLNTQTDDTGSVTAYLDEYTPAGAYVGQIAIPTVTTGSNNPLTLNNASNVSHEGILTLSENGQYLSFVGYDQGQGDANPLNPTTVGTIGVIGNSAYSLNTSTTIANGAQNMRAATTIDSNEFYVAMAHGSSASGPGGLNYVTGIGPDAANTVLGGTLDSRSVQILGGANPSTGVLAAGSGSSSFEVFGSASGHGVFGLQNSGGGLPTSAASLTGSQINSDATDGSDMVFVNEPGNANSYNGYNTLYVAGNTSAVDGFIEKYAYNGTQFVPDGSIVDTTGTTDPVGITVQTDPNTGDQDIFYTLPTGIYELNALDDSEDSFLSSTSTLVASAPTGSYFYGVANAPIAAPEPATLGLLALGSLGLLGRRRRQIA